MIRPYLELMRIHKPAGGLLFFWPMIWGLGMASYTSRTPFVEILPLLLKTVFGAFIIRSPACTVNDIFDRKFDAAVERTKGRPMASGRVSVFSATVFLLLQYLIGVLFFSTLRIIQFLNFFLRFIIYPLIKRVSYWPQAWLAIGVNVGFIQSWYQIDNDLEKLPSAIWLMFTGMFCWTMMYDTVYGCQDRKDDIKVGVWSTSLFFGDYVWYAAAIFDAAFVLCLYYAGVANGHGTPYFVVSVGGTAVQLLYQLMILDVDSTQSCWENFKNNAFILGPLVFAGIMADYARVLRA
ncbi:UbiA prenyltransferase [Fomitiporia mediterranea MF3/22]|uniref:UbiA prenyltransferase n=1 Tax=Fomitiporia mediterranea (strain MF3/22) TaxID=694068 RepID=UPI0004409823|nr:UbiA prenyltransferase [Fomitiporia mediterranea MF3/22]EJC99728.1 UbiA prenyltransferase [Fomitiporia mediterranea MF3/22]